MREYLQYFFDLFNYPNEARTALCGAYDALYSDKHTAQSFDALLNRYETDINCDFRQLLAEMDSLCEAVLVHKYTGELLLCVCMSRALREFYRSAGLSDELWHRCMCDLKYKLIECQLVYGIWGSFVCAWFDRFFNMTRFAFERLQFELIPFRKSYEKNSLHLNEESTVINVHIPRTGGRLSAAEIEASYRQASEFFQERYSLEQIVFVCSSWLLYPKNLEVLSESSNLHRFISDYDIIQWGTYPDYSQIWRLFDANYAGNTDLLPQNTSLRRAYADWIRTGVKTGWGFGVYVYKA